MKKLLYFVVAFVFVLGLAACGTKADPNQKAFDEAYKALNIVTNEDVKAVISDFTVNKALRGGVNATWTSSDTNYAAVIAGDTTDTIKVTRPENGMGNKEITLTAKVVIDKLSKNKEFKFTILEMPMTEVMTLSKLRDDLVASGTDVTIKDLVVVALDEDAYHVSDGVTTMMVYGAPGPGVEIGVKGDITAKVDAYFDAYQLKEASWANTTTGNEIVTKDVNLADYDMLDNDGNDAAIKAAKLNNANYGVLKFTAKIVLRSDFTGGANYQLQLVDPAAASNDVSFVLSYYKGAKHAELMLLSGQEVEITAVIRELRDSRAVANTIKDGSVPMYSFSVISYVMPTLEDSEKVVLDEKSFSINTNYTEAGDVVLPTAGSFGSAISYAFKNVDDANNTLVNLTTGAITVPATGQVKVPVVVTFTSGTEVKTKTITFVLGEVQMTTIAVVNGLVDGDGAKVVGVVTANEYQATFFIQDETGGIAVFTYDEAMKATLKANLGKKVEVLGERASYKGMIQIKPEYVKAVDGDVTPIVPAIVTLDQVNLDTFKGQLVTLENLTVVSNTLDSNKNVLVVLTDGTNQVTMKWDSRIALSTEAAATLALLVKDMEVSLTLPLAWADGAFLYYSDSTVVVFAVETDEMKINADANAIDVVSKVEASGSITLPVAGEKGSVIEWSSDNEAITAAGVVTAPATGSVTVTLTATLKLNDETKVMNYTVVVGVSSTSGTASDLFISEYIEGSSNNKAIEIYNGTGDAVNLEGYKLALYANGKTEIGNFIDLTGTLANGETLVIVNGSIADDFKVSGYIESTVTFFNGDDAIVLSKNGLDIDVFGVVGIDPGSSWPVGTGTTADYTLVRKASVTGPTTTWDESEWEVHAKDTSSFLGSHTME